MITKAEVEYDEATGSHMLTVELGTPADRDFAMRWFDLPTLLAEVDLVPDLHAEIASLRHQLAEVTGPASHAGNCPS